MHSPFSSWVLACDCTRVHLCLYVRVYACTAQYTPCMRVSSEIEPSAGNITNLKLTAITLSICRKQTFLFARVLAPCCAGINTGLHFAFWLYVVWFQTYKWPKFVISLAFQRNGDILTGDSNGSILVWSAGEERLSAASIAHSKPLC